MRMKRQKYQRGVLLERHLMSLLSKNPRLGSYFALSSDEEDRVEKVDLWAGGRPVQVTTCGVLEEQREFLKYKSMYTRALMKRTLATQAQVVLVVADTITEQDAVNLLRFLFKTRIPGDYILKGEEVEVVT